MAGAKPRRGRQESASGKRARTFAFRYVGKAQSAESLLRKRETHRARSMPHAQKPARALSRRGRLAARPLIHSCALLSFAPRKPASFAAGCRRPRHVGKCSGAAA